MRFADDVVLFDFAGFSILGCTSTGAFVGLSPDEKEACSEALSSDARKIPSSVFSTEAMSVFSQGGFISSCDRTALPVTAYFHVTQRCNLRCIGCYSWNSLRNRSDDLATVDSLSILRKLGLIGVKNLIISGGEPFLRKDLAELVIGAKGSGIESVSVITNGTLLNIDALQKMAPFVDCVAVSFDGYSSESPSLLRGQQRFGELKKAIALIQDCGIKAHIIATIHSCNIYDIPSYISLARSLGTTINFSLLSASGDNNEIRDLLLDNGSLESLAGMLIAEFDSGFGICDVIQSGCLSVKKCCGAGVKCLSVSSEGLLYPCHMLQRDEFFISNLLVDEIADVKERIKTNIFYEMSAVGITECAECEFVHVCGGGCRARSVMLYRDACHKDPYCALFKRYYQAVSKMMGEALSRDESRPFGDFVLKEDAVKR